MNSVLSQWGSWLKSTSTQHMATFIILASMELKSMTKMDTSWSILQLLLIRKVFISYKECKMMSELLLIWQTVRIRHSMKIICGSRLSRILDPTRQSPLLQLNRNLNSILILLIIASLTSFASALMNQRPSVLSKSGTIVKHQLEE